MSYRVVWEGAQWGPLPVTLGSGVPQLWPVLPPQVAVLVTGRRDRDGRPGPIAIDVNRLATNVVHGQPMLPARPSLLLPVV